jgi:hypothetical protein
MEIRADIFGESGTAACADMSDRFPSQIWSTLDLWYVITYW